VKKNMRRRYVKNVLTAAVAAAGGVLAIAIAVAAACWLLVVVVLLLLPLPLLLLLWGKIREEKEKGKESRLPGGYMGEPITWQGQSGSRDDRPGDNPVPAQNG
jgi:hypothetical protein